MGGEGRERGAGAGGAFGWGRRNQAGEGSEGGEITSAECLRANERTEEAAKPRGALPADFRSEDLQCSCSAFFSLLPKTSPVHTPFTAERRRQHVVSLAVGVARSLLAVAALHRDVPRRYGHSPNRYRQVSRNESLVLLPSTPPPLVL